MCAIRKMMTMNVREFVVMGRVIHVCSLLCTLRVVAIFIGRFVFHDLESNAASSADVRKIWSKRNQTQSGLTVQSLF